MAKMKSIVRRGKKIDVVDLPSGFKVAKSSRSWVLRGTGYQVHLQRFGSEYTVMLAKVEGTKVKVIARKTAKSRKKAYSYVRSLINRMKAIAEKRKRRR